MDWVATTVDRQLTLRYPMVSRTEWLQVSEVKAVGEVGLLGLSPGSMVSDDVVDTFLRLVAVERSATHGLSPRVARPGHNGVHFLPTGWLWTQRRGILGMLHSA
eukprot:869816-Rhodomonas_salina.1